jgi:hypothetical protein
VIRLIDALAVQKNLDGSLAALQWSDLLIEEAEGLGTTVGALLGLGAGGEAGMEAGAIAGREAGSDGHLIDESEVWDVADSIEPGGAAAIALIEHVWAVPLRAAIAKAGGVAVSDEWVHPPGPRRDRAACLGRAVTRSSACENGIGPPRASG